MVKVSTEYLHHSAFIRHSSARAEKRSGKITLRQIHVIDAVIKKSLYSHKRENNEDLNTLIVMSHLIYLQ